LSELSNRHGIDAQRIAVNGGAILLERNRVVHQCAVTVRLWPRKETKNSANDASYPSFGGKNVSVANERSHPIILRLCGFSADNGPQAVHTPKRRHMAR
jgi:hypothetical protein